MLTLFEMRISSGAVDDAIREPLSPADLHAVRELIDGNIDVSVSSWNPTSVDDS
jgi:hypothetical protein